MKMYLRPFWEIFTEIYLDIISAVEDVTLFNKNMQSKLLFRLMRSTYETVYLYPVILSSVNLKFVVVQ